MPLESIKIILLNIKFDIFCELLKRKEPKYLQLIEIF